MRGNEIELNVPQWKAFNSTSKETMFISGVGGGKTFLLAILAYKYQQIGNTIGLISSPTFDVLRTATFKGIEKAFTEIGLIEGVDYVINIRPPDDWGVKPFSKLNNTRIVTWRSGSYTILESLDNFNKLRGTEFDYIVVDEFRDVKFSEVRKVLLGRLRGSRFMELSMQHQIFWVSTPPDDVRELNKALEDKTIKVIQGTSFDNKKHLPEDYIETMLNSYDTLTAQREVYGKIVSMNNDMAFAYAYDRDYSYVSFNKNEYKLNPKEPVKIAFDFNVNPITCIIGQSDDDNIRIFKALSAENSDTSQLCDMILSYLGNNRFSIFVTGDANGYKRDTRGTLNDYQIIQTKLGLSKYQLLAPRMNASLRDSRVLCNAILSHADLAIDSDNDNCKDLDDDLITVTVDESGKPDKKKHGSHTLDNFRYYLHTWHYDFLKRKL